ncbi:MAG: hypothetical protein OEW58_02500 [Gammaproteobacteria bacterium]|nr:hypothetical protein [Gammaproteobacteria bacterium]
MRFPIILCLAACLPLASCIESKQPLNSAEPTGFARPINDGDLAAMTPLQQYQVYNKLLSTLYKGEPAADFFDLSKGLENPQLKQHSLRIRQLKQNLHKSVVDDTYYANLVQQKHGVSLGMDNPRPAAYAMAMLHEMPITRTYYYHWIAYQLTNNIMFSPGLELDSVFPKDAQTVYERLIHSMEQNHTIRDIVYQHMISQENWRRFRSPEDNTREMMEIFLLRFDDSEVPKASTACKNWFLNVNNSYMLQYDGAPVNQQPQLGLLNRDSIRTCDEFYRAIAEHPSLIPSITSRLIDHFFYGYSVEFKQAFLNSVTAANPVHFDELFDAIVFSYEYLTKVTRPRSYEENFLAGAGRLRWVAANGFFSGKTSEDTSSNVPNLANMTQKSMTYKLGRPWKIPMDSLSLANYHKSIRDELFLRTRGQWPTDLITSPQVNALSDQDFIHYLFLNAVMRKATPAELQAMQTIFQTNNVTTRMNRAYIVFDYTSRLAETYHLPAFEEVPQHEY